MTIILGIESSCDETAAAVVTSSKTILSNVIFSQITEHEQYGGVVPELAARAHANNINQTVCQALSEAQITLEAIDAIAVTGGPGLIGGVIVGVMAAKGIALATGKPILFINHLEGHALTARLTSDLKFPFLLLLASGGHSQFLIVEGVGQYTKIGATIDDSIGEAFDKVAKMLRLPYPGGPAIEQLAKLGEAKLNLPLSMVGRIGCDMSFSGLKTAVKRLIDSRGELDERARADIAASFQKIIGDILVDRLEQAIKIFQSTHGHNHSVVMAGGVAANLYLRERLSEVAINYQMDMVAPPLKLCTDNAAMIAWAGMEKYNLGMFDDLSFEPRARWPL
jgi:N6-L-threonylcarbamoyladenine synthase